MQYEIKLRKPLSFSDSEIGETSRFGAYRGIKGGGTRKHAGIDIYRDRGTPVMASFGGRVIRTAEHEIYGGLVIIDHTPKQRLGEDPYMYTLYAHLNSVETWLGRKVSQGEIIGTVGNTGNASKMKPHLHFEVIRAPCQADWQLSGSIGLERGRYRIDPLPVLRGRAFLFKGSGGENPLTICKH